MSKLFKILSRKYLSYLMSFNRLRHRIHRYPGRPASCDFCHWRLLLLSPKQPTEDDLSWLRKVSNEDDNE
jgi:hypothetical protein